ncbi:ABC transporter substrate-binding protein [Actinomadura kijaniata]|uniref:ABC transporter substrate-binding protein n=1 Tax=Actinomadura kijaniata TaxID=46161 RepID=UPI000837A8CB|nr:ABC transporter substrate-binding protein [Actinomadura kijaniata]
MRRTRALLTALLPLAAAGCTVAGNAAAGDGDTVRIVVGYQSKTINTVTAGTLLRSLGAFERRLAGLGRAEGRRYAVVWQDHDTGAPITAQMLAGKIDIGSMGDYPLLINGSRAQAQGGDAATRLVSVTGYNLRGALNSVVVAPGSPARTLRDLKGRTVSTSVGSAGHGTFVQAFRKYGLDATRDVRIENQQPSIGASKLQSGGADGLAQFVAWPGLLVGKGQARVLYDGGDLGVPTFHGVVVREAFADRRPRVLQAFLDAQLDATRHLNAEPLRAAESVAAATGLPVETVYLYNGPAGVATFDTEIRRELRDALAHDVPFLKSIGVLQKPVDLAAFVDDTHITRARARTAPIRPARITGTDEVCGKPVTDPAKAGEVWVRGEARPRPVADPTCLLRTVRSLEGRPIRAAYVPDTANGTRWFADRDVWVEDDGTFKPFTTDEAARRYVAGHDGARIVSYAEAVRRA